jgi:hypothetical protein
VASGTFAYKSEVDYADLDPFWMDEVACTGSESSILDCPFGPGGNNEFGDNDCSGSEAVQLRCPASNRRLSTTKETKETKSRAVGVENAKRAAVMQAIVGSAQGGGNSDSATAAMIDVVSKAQKTRGEAALAAKKAALANKYEKEQRRLTSSESSGPVAVAPLACSVMRTILNLDTDLLRSHIGTRAVFYVDAPRPLLNSTDRTWFSTVGDGVKKAMIRSISETFSEEKYFDQCKPHTCTYYRVRPLTVAGVITIVLGVLGGLSVTIRTVVAAVVGFVGPMLVGMLFPTFKVEAPPARRDNPAGTKSVSPEVA